MSDNSLNIILDSLSQAIAEQRQEFLRSGRPSHYGKDAANQVIEKYYRPDNIKQDLKSIKKLAKFLTAASFDVKDLENALKMKVTPRIADKVNNQLLNLIFSIGTNKIDYKIAQEFKIVYYLLLLIPYATQADDDCFFVEELFGSKVLEVISNNKIPEIHTGKNKPDYGFVARDVYKEYTEQMSDAKMPLGEYIFKFTDGDSIVVTRMLSLTKNLCYLDNSNNKLKTDIMANSSIMVDNVTNMMAQIGGKIKPYDGFNSANVCCSAFFSFMLKHRIYSKYFNNLRLILKSISEQTELFDEKAAIIVEAEKYREVIDNLSKVIDCITSTSMTRSFIAIRKQVEICIFVLTILKFAIEYICLEIREDEDVSIIIGYLSLFRDAAINFFEILEQTYREINLSFHQQLICQE